MKLTLGLVLAAAVVALAAPAAGAAPAAPDRLESAAARCPTLPPARFRGSPAKIGAWVGTCIVCNAAGPRAYARAQRLPRSDAAFVARWYARSSPAARRFRTQLGGAAAAEALLYDACLTGFRTRGRP
jgi:hypothetical protein